MKQTFKKVTQFWWVAVLMAVIPGIIKAGIPDSDTYFLAATGRFIIENGYVPTINPFVIHENFGVIIQQGLFDVFIYGIYNTWGNMGLYVYLLTTYTVSMLLLYKYFSLFSKNSTVKGILMTVAGIVLVTYSTARPTSLSFPILLALLYCVEQYRRTNKNIYLAPLPALSLLEINIHAAMWPMMFVLILPYVFPYTVPRKENLKGNIQKWFKKNKSILLILVLMFGVGFINPNGINGMTYVLQSYGSATNGLVITELKPPATNDYRGIMIMAICAIFAIFLYKNKAHLTDPSRDNQKEFTRIYMTAGVLILAFSHSRNMWYLLLGAFPMVLETLDGMSFPRKKKEKKKSSSLKIIGGALLTTVLLITAYFINTEIGFSAKTNNDSQYAPMAAADYLDEKQKEDIVLYTEFNNGAYMEWRGYKVYMDARPELFQKNINGQEDIYQEFSNVTTGNIDYQEFLDKYNFTHLIVSDNARLDIYLSLNEEYTPVVDGEGYTLYESVQK